MNIRSIYPPGVAKEVMEKLKSPDFGGVGKLTSFPIYPSEEGWGIDRRGSFGIDHLR